MSMIVRPPALVADHPGQRTAKFKLARNIRNVSHFALQALYVERVLRSIGPPTRHQEATQTPLRLGQGEEGVAHRCRDEELVTDQFAGLTGAFSSCRQGAGGVGAHVRPALFFRHRHATTASRNALSLA